ncbi:MAG: phosphoglycerate mutase [Gammaproteobacteria bacterium]|mgnify:FL=1|nr:MAG: phosphoglycerate mutase [Gammaproteobacteria bacterium]
MKTLHLIRHAKSDWDAENQRDIDRPLNKRGRKACKIMAQRIIDAGCNLEKVFCSPAERAQQTIKGIAEALAPRDITWEIDYELYTFDSQDLLDWLDKVEDAIDELVLVGHNPALTELTNLLGEMHLENLPTCGYVQIQLDIHTWNEISANCGKLQQFLTPKD